MSKSITFVTKSHTVGKDDTSSAEIIDEGDVGRIASEKVDAAVAKSRLEFERLSNENKRALCDVAASAQAQIKRLDAVDNRFRELPDMVKKTLREVLLSQLQPLLELAKVNIDILRKDNCNLKDKTSSLSNALENHRERLETLEKQIRELPDKAREVLLGSILAELQPRIDSAKEDIARLQSDNDELRNEISSLHAGISSCQEELKQELASAQETNCKLKAEIASLRAELSLCQANLDAHLNPPKKKAFFKRLYFKMRKLIQRKTSADTTTPSPKGS